MKQSPAIETTGLTKSYRDIKVLQGIDLQVERGSVYALLGPNGAGKTTIVRILTTLVRADAGMARVVGLGVERDRHRVRQSISFSGQDTTLDETQTGEENLIMMGRLAHLSHTGARRRSQDLLVAMDLAEAGGRRVATYSGGMRRRLDLAAGLVRRPAVLFLDEPTTGLDVRSRQATWDMVRELSGSGVTVLLTTQYLEEADALANRVAVIDDGAVAEGRPAELKSRVAEQRLDLTMTNETTFSEVARCLGGRVVPSHGDPLTVGVTTDGTAAHVRALLDEIDPQRVTVARFALHIATLDDVFLALTGHGPMTSTPESVDA